MTLFMFGILFIIFAQPMFMISILIFIIILYSLHMYMLLMGYWFSYLLMMVMLSGVMVLFSYMASLFPNESFESSNMMYTMLLLLLLMFEIDILLYSMGDFYITLLMWISCFSMYNIFVVVFLLLMLLVVVWLSSMNEGSIRIY